MISPAACKSLQLLSLRLLEILVVDNAPEGAATRDVVAGSPDVRYVAEPRPGSAGPANAGVRAARGSIVAFTDDDVRVTPIGSRPWSTVPGPSISPADR